MISSRKTPGVAFWATVAVVMGLVAYPLSFGPACWWASRTSPKGEWNIPAFYRPIVRTMSASNGLCDFMEWWTIIGAASNWVWVDRHDGHGPRWCCVK